MKREDYKKELEKLYKIAIEAEDVAMALEILGRLREIPEQCAWLDESSLSVPLQVPGSPVEA